MWRIKLLATSQGATEARINSFETNAVALLVVMNPYRDLASPLSASSPPAYTSGLVSQLTKTGFGKGHPFTAFSHSRCGRMVYNNCNRLVPVAGAGTFALQLNDPESARRMTFLRFPSHGATTPPSE